MFSQWRYFNTKYSASKDIPVQNIQSVGDIPVQNIQPVGAIPVQNIQPVGDISVPLGGPEVGEDFEEVVR
jgi:hypothetical protein